MSNRFKNFNEFYPYYLNEHRNLTCRCLHYFGTSLGLILFIFCLWKRQFAYIPIAMVAGYLFAWVGHYVFEKNRPATFQYPLYSFLGDWVMLKDAIINRKL